MSRFCARVNFSNHRRRMVRPHSMVCDLRPKARYWTRHIDPLQIVLNVLLMLGLLDNYAQWTVAIKDRAVPNQLRESKIVGIMKPLVVQVVLLAS
jgi:hypothetical protein